MQLIRFNITIVLIIIVSCPLWICAQIPKKSGFIPPLKIPLLLSGNFGELRSNHIHSGLDFKTYGLPGLNVYAADDGYVSRIKIEQSGFGNAVYISHPNGYTSVYGHLSKFRPDIDSLANACHYKENKFSIEIFLKPNELKVKKGEVIAFSGNSGGSMGPHLHFEIRDKSQMPVNIQRYFNFPIKDTIPPKIFNVWIYPMDSLSFINHENLPKCFKVIQTNDKTIMEAEQPILIKGKITFGIETLDFMNSSSNTLGVYSIELYFNNQLKFSQVIDRILFSENRSVNSLIDYGYYLKNRVRINRLYVQPNNKLSVYHGVQNQGVILPKDSSVCNVRIRVSDNNLNISEVKFDVKYDMKKEITIPKPSLNSGEVKLINCFVDDNFRNDQVEIHFPAFSMFDNFLIYYESLPGMQIFFSDIHHFKNEDVPINKPVNLKIKPKNLPVKLQSKALLARINDFGEMDWFGGGYSGGFVSAPIKAFGKYAIVVDTIAPCIVPINKFVKNQDFSDWDKIAFTVTDSQSGISFFSGKIDGQWALFEYDEKQDLIYYRFDLRRIKRKMKHSLDFVVIDKKGNKANYHSTIYK